MARNRMICNGDWNLHGHEALFILLDEKGFHDHKKDIKDKLEKAGIQPGLIMVDQLLHTGNTSTRFLRCNWNGKNINGEQLIRLPEQHEIRRISAHMLAQSGIELPA